MAHAKGRGHFSKLNGVMYFTTLDLQGGYHHIPLDKPSIPKTAFNSPFRKYEYIKVPFGLAQAPAYFQELMTGILKDINFAIPYLDNIIIFSKTPQEHLSYIRKVFEKLRSAKLSMKMSKCNFFSKEIWYLGHILSATGIQPLPSKTHAIQHMQPPTMPKTSLSFSWVSWILQEVHKRIFQNCQATNNAHTTKVKFEWTSVHHTAFLHLKEVIMQAPILHYPDLDKNILYTQMLPTMHVGHSSHRNTMAQSFPWHFCHTCSQRLKVNGAQLSMRTMESTTPSLSGTTTYKALTSLSRMIINHLHSS